MSEQGAARGELKAGSGKNDAASDGLRAAGEGAPRGWISAPLGSYLYLKNGYAFKSAQYVEPSELTVPVIRISDINGSTASDEKANHVAEVNKQAGFEVEKGDILIAMSGATTGKTGVYVGLATAYQNQRVGNLKLHFDSLGSKKFRDYLIEYLRPEILKAAYGGAQPNVSGKTIEEMVVGFPPLAEQKVIAEKLDTLLAQVDNIKTRLDAIPTIIKRFRQSVLSAAVSGKLTGIKSGASTTVGEACEVIGGLTKNAKRKDFVLQLPYLRVANVYENELRLGDVANIGVKEKELNRVLLKKKDLLIVEGNGSLDQIGRVALWDDTLSPCVHQNHLIKIRSNPEKIISEYLLYFFMSPQGKTEIVNKATSGAGLYTLSISKISSIILNVFTIEEQTEIVSRVEKLFAFADQIEKQVSNGQQRVNNLTQSVLAKAFRGELTADWRAQNPDLITGENSAEALLEKIKLEREKLKPVKKTRKKKA